MDGVHAFGRGFSDAEAFVAKGKEGVIIRVTTKKNPELWVHVVITPAALLDMINQCGVKLDQAGDLDQLPRVQMPDTPDLPPPGPI